MNLANLLFVIALSLWPELSSAQTPANSAPHWTVVDRIPVSGDVGWDYVTVDSSSHRIYLAHSTSVVVLDLATKKVLAIMTAVGAHGIALAPDLQRGFFTNGVLGQVSFFALPNFKVFGSAKAGGNPDAICYEPLTQRVYAFNGRSASVSVIDAKEGNAVCEIPLGGRPEFATTDGHGELYVNIENKDLVSKIDARKLIVQSTWPLPPGSHPTAMAIDVERARLFVGCGNQQLIVLDTVTGRNVASLPIGQGVDAVCYDPVKNRVFASCADGTLTVIHQDSDDKYSLQETIATEKGSRTMGFDSATGLAYVPTAKFGPAPAATPDHPFPRPIIEPGSFTLLVLKDQ